jgi:hypothetical protein
MKQYLVPALTLALLGVSLASLAQSGTMDHSCHGMPGMMMGMSHDGKSGPVDHAAGGMMGMGSADMQAMRESMQKRMSAAQTDAERQALMAEQQKLMMEKRMRMMPM